MSAATNHRCYYHIRSIPWPTCSPFRCLSIARGTSTQSALTAYHLDPMSLALGMCGSSHWLVICRNAASLSLPTKNLMTLVLSFAHQTRKSFGISPASLSTSLMPYVMICFATSMVATFSAAPPSTRLTSITGWRLWSLSAFPPLVVRKRVVPDPAAPPLAAIVVHNYVNGDFVDRGDTERISSCARRELITSWRLAFWFLRYCCSDLIS